MASASRIIVKAAGPLSAEALIGGASPSVAIEDKAQAVKASNALSAEPDSHTRDFVNAERDLKDFIVSPSTHIKVADYIPEVDTDGTWWVSEIDCESLATGSSILACGDGGPGYMCYMVARDALQKGARMPIVSIDSLPKETWILGNISYGAPTVTLERTPSGTEEIGATDAMLSMYPDVKMGA